MKSAVFRLVLAALLFFGWIGWLAYLTTTLSHSVVLSRPQLLVSDLAVIAQVDSDGSDDSRPGATVDVREVAWSRDGKDKDLEGKSISVPNLPEISREDGWEGPGRYLIPLVKKQAGADGATQYSVPGIPSSPGFPHGKDRRRAGTSGARGGRRTDPRIYRATDDALRQLENIRQGHWE
jgi:hypothetical protein